MQTTPKRRDSGISAVPENYSPVIILESPVAKTPQRGNLTGHPRLVRDIAADIHASIQQWNNIHLHAVPILKNICQLKVDQKYPPCLQELCDMLETDCDALDEIVTSLGMLSKQMRAAVSLHKSPESMFLTWPSQKFGEVTEKIYAAYEEEAKVKRYVLENIAHSHEEAMQMLYLASWVHQTNIPENLTTALESMLVETGHR